MTEKSAMPGQVEEIVNGYWRVRYGPGLTEVHNLRGCDFRGVQPHEGLEVELFYEMGRTWGLWRARPIENGAAHLYGLTAGEAVETLRLLGDRDPARTLRRHMELGHLVLSRRMRLMPPELGRFHLLLGRSRTISDHRSKTTT